MEKISINKRFIEAVEYLLLNGKVESKGMLASVLGIKSTKFSEILNERMNIGTDLAAILCSQYNISIEWLIAGKGEMIRKESVSSAAQTGVANYQGRFNNVHTVIGNNNNSRKSAVTPVEGNRNMVGGAVVEGGAMNNGSAPNNDSITLERCFIENEYLKKEIETLKDRLNQSIIEKDKIMNLLQNVLNK